MNAKQADAVRSLLNITVILCSNRLYGPSGTSWRHHAENGRQGGGHVQRYVTGVAYRLPGQSMVWQGGQLHEWR